MINVLHVLISLQVGGLEKFVLELIRCYPPEIRPFIACLEGKGVLGDRCENLQIFELNKPHGISFATVRKLNVLVKTLNIDLIHTHNDSPHFYGAFSGILTKKPVIHTKHNRRHPINFKKTILNKFSTFNTHKVVAVSSDAYTVCTKTEKTCDKKVMVITNGVDIDRFKFIERTRTIDNIPCLGIVARLSPEKDHKTLLQACRILQERNVRYRLVIIGDGPLRAALEKYTQELSLNNAVQFAGLRHDVAELMEEFDIFTLSSVTEGISITLLEAMATGLPVVATDVGGNPEVVIDGITGFIVPAQNPEALANKLARLIKDKEMCRTMGIAGRTRVEAQFSIRETAQKYVAVYHEVLEGQYL